MSGSALDMADPAESRTASVDRDGAISELFLAHHARLVIVAQMIVGDLATAEDVVQDAFASLYRRWPWLHEKGAAIGYVHTSVANGARSNLRQRRRMPTTELVDTAMPLAPAPDDATLRHDAQRELTAGLAELPVRQRQVIVLRYYLDQSEAEIAATLSISKGSVKKHASRALATLGTRLKEVR
jgi:RNA polymerase sigma-70 factor (sigma-E family)